ncbi:MAG TPA: sortase [Acidimicrobiales bacterium]|nr:sortase [Acidimicrobiales bacterium]
MTTDMLEPSASHSPAGDETDATGMAPADALAAGIDRPLLVRRAVGALVTAFGILILVLVLFLYTFTPLTAGRDQHRLLASLTGNPLSTFALTKGTVPPEGSPVALLRIPRLHLTEAVVAGTSASDLEAGPGLMSGTVLPGEQGNAVIAGRRVTFGGPFHSIGTLRRGDEARVTDGLGTFRYRVRSLGTVVAGQHDVVGGTKDNRLTLITSNSSVATTGREVVELALVGRPVPSPTQVAQVIPPYQRGLSGEPGAGWKVLLWVVLFLLAAATTGVALARWRRPLPTYLLAAPILLACGLFAVEAVGQALPATF